MSRRKKVIRNFIIIVISFYLLISILGISLTPISAHKYSERSIHYGPSEVIHVENYGKGKYFLCKYDKWVSCDYVKRVFFLLWKLGDSPTGFENDKTKPINFSGGYSDSYNKLYGIINDNRIKKVQLTLSNGEVLTQTQFYEDLFLFTWKSSDNIGTFFKSIKGYDDDNNVIFEENHPVY